MIDKTGVYATLNSGTPKADAISFQRRPWGISGGAVLIDHQDQRLQHVNP